MEWISVEDELPPSCDEVFIWPRPEFNDMEIYTASYYIHSNCFEVWDGCDHTPVPVTHWMPLPDPPKDR